MVKQFRTPRYLVRDPDVLDTWFSSALWPFATMGWPDSSSPSPRLRGEGRGEGQSQATPLETAPLPTLSPEGERASSPTLHGRYPNDILISGFDILFFWDARMMMQGIHFMKDVPFRKLYLHGLVRAADGAKMSKSKGNVVNPLGLIDQYGADALRFFMAAMESQGRDIKMDERRVEGYRNFATKLWNACRFAQSNGIGASTSPNAPAATLAVNKWIIAETIQTVQAVDLALADLRFDGAANAVYQFVWSRFCDWYLELIKPVMVGDEKGEIDVESKAVAGWVIDQILVLLHPFMPFITEELWHAMADPAHPRENDLIVAKWPMADARSIDPEASKEIDWLIRLVSEIRAARTELNVPPGLKLELYYRETSEETKHRLGQHQATISRLARTSPRYIFGNVPAPTGASIQIVLDDTTFVIPLGHRVRRRNRTRASDQSHRGGGEGARRARRSPVQRQLRRARQAGSGGEGARRSCRQGRRGGAAERGAWAVGVR